MAIDFRADPIGPRTKGWKPRGQGKIRLMAGWEPLPGAGQEDLSRHEWDDAAPADAAPPTDPTPAPDLSRHEWPTTPAPAPNERRTTFPATPTPTNFLTVAPKTDYPVRSTAAAVSAPAPTPAPTTSGATGRTGAAPAVSAPGAAPSQSTQSPGSAGGGTPSQPSAPPPTGSKQDQFIQDLLPFAKRASAASGIPWEVYMAIAANETGYDEAGFHNNLFGIKDPKGTPARTWEVINGARVDITDNFATFSNLDEAFQGLTNFLTDNPRYADALNYIHQNPNDWPTFVHMIHKAGYATDPTWSDKIVQIGQGMESYGGGSAPAQSTSGSVWNSANQATNQTQAVPGGRPSQFSDPTIPWGTAAQICGPAAAVAFARANGRNPTLKEAMDMASARGDWSLGTGMHGVGSEQDLLAQMGVNTHLQNADPKAGLDWSLVQQDVANGNPVILDTPGHYWVVDGYNPQTQQYHVGTSGTDLVGGAEWMTANQINMQRQSEGPVRAALHLDASGGQRPSVAANTGPTSTSSNGPNVSTTTSNTNRTTSSSTQKKADDLDQASREIGKQGNKKTAANFVRWAYKNGLGVDLPDNATAIMATSTPIDISAARPGDVVVYGMSSDGTVSDIGIYAGGGKMLHDNGAGVSVEDLPNGASIRRVPGISDDQLWQGAGNEPPIKTIEPQGTGQYLVTFQDGTHKVMQPTRHNMALADAKTPTVQAPQPDQGTGHEVGAGQGYRPSNAHLSPLENALRQIVDDAISARMGAGVDVGGPDRPDQPDATNPVPDVSNPTPRRLPRTPTTTQQPPDPRQVAASGVQGAKDLVSGATSAVTGFASQVPAFVGAPGTVSPVAQASATDVHEMRPTQFAPGGGYDPSHLGQSVAQAKAAPGIPRPVSAVTPIAYDPFKDKENAKHAITAAAIAGSVVAAPVVAGAAAPVIGETAAGILGTSVANSLPMLPSLAMDIHSGDMTKVKGDLAMIGAGMIAGPASERALGIAEALGDRALAPVIARVEQSPFGEALIQMLAEDSGSLNIGNALRLGQRVGGPVGRTIANAGKGGAVGYTVGAATQFAAEASDFATDNHWQDPNWWANVISDANSAGVAGGVMGIGFGAVAAPLRWGWDHTVDPWVIQRTRGVLEPIRNVKIYDAQGNLDKAATLNTQRTLTNGLRGDRQAEVEANIVKVTGENLFGKSGQGYNTAEALAYIEEHKSLVGFNQTQWGRGLPNVTADQEEWVKQRVRYENMAGNRARANGSLQPTQDVTDPTGVNTFAPKVHVYHMFENDPAIGKHGSNVKGRGWRESVTNQRRESTNSAAPPGTRATLRERLDEYYSSQGVGINTPKVHDSMVDSFEASTFQQERSYTRREMWNDLRGGPATVTHQQMLQDPLRYKQWRDAEKQWQFGQGTQQYAFDPNVYTVLHNVTTDPGPYLSALQWLGSVTKGALFLGSPVHLWNIVQRSMSLVGGPNTGIKDFGRFNELMFHYILPSMISDGPRNMMLDNPDLFRRAAAAGLTGKSVDTMSRNASWWRTATMMGASALGGAAGGWLNAKRQGMSDEEAERQAFIWGAVGAGIASPAPGLIAKGATLGQTNVRAATNAADIMHEVIFNRVLPMAKVGSFDILTRAAPHLDEEMIATQINNTLGGINTFEMGRNPWAQDLLRFFSVAPDWEEGQVRQMFNVFSGGQAGSFTRQQVVRTISTYMGQIELLNQAFNGHPTWQNEQGHQYELETTGIINAIANLSGQHWMQDIDPQTKRPIRTYADPLPSLRWIMQTLGEFGRYGGYWAGRGEQALGQQVGGQNTQVGPLTVGGPEMQQAGLKLQQRAYGDWAHGELPPDPARTIATDISQRIGPAPGVAGTLGDVISGQFHDWNGQGYQPPGTDTAPMWSKWATGIAHVLTPMEPAMLQSAQQKINLSEPGRTRWGDAAVEILGITRAQAETENQDMLTRRDQLLQMAGVTPEAQAIIQDEHTKEIAANEAERQTIFTRVAAGNMTHANAEAQLRGLSEARKYMSRARQVRMDYGQLFPDDPQRSRALSFLMNVYNVTEPGSAPADVDAKIDTNTLAMDYWNPHGFAASDTTGITRARRALINNTAVETGESPDALMDQIKWGSLHKDIRTGAVAPFPTLQGMTSDQLDQATTGYIDSGNDPATGLRYDDPNQAADAQRAYLDQFATSHNVNVDNLQQRIRLRLSPMAQPNATEISYQNAQQAYFDSRDDAKHPQYLDENGQAIGGPLQWNGPPGHPEKGWNYALQAVGAKGAKRDPTLEAMAQAKQRGDEARKVFLLTNQNNSDWEKWYGQQGRNMNESQWQDYQDGKVIGYRDLAGDLNAPKDETKRRDKIREIYAAMPPDDQVGQTVDVWQNGAYRTLSMRGAYRFILRQNLNVAGRTLLNQEIADQQALADTVP